MAGLPNLANRDYARRVNRAVDYIMQNLAEPLRLEDVANAACFSPYHFHRIFRGLMGETLASFVKRIRLERAVQLLSYRRSASLTDIALACGFSSSSDFSRSFRGHYGVSPRRFDLEKFRESRRENLQRTLPANQDYELDRQGRFKDPDEFAVRLRNLPGRHVAYIRVHRPYGGDGVREAMTRLIAWAETRGLADGQWLGYQWDDPEVVPLDKCRYDVGLEVPATVVADEHVSVMSFDPCVAAEIDIRGSVEVELRALEWFFDVWLPGSGYAPAHQPMFEAFNGRPFAHGLEYFELRAQLPLVDATLPV